MNVAMKESFWFENSFGTIILLREECAVRIQIRVTVSHGPVTVGAQKEKRKSSSVNCTNLSVLLVGDHRRLLGPTTTKSTVAT